MSFLFGSRTNQSSSAKKIRAAEQEFELVTDMFHRLTQSCALKCLSAQDYRESDLLKGESVCLDRCAAKFFTVNIKISEKMQRDVTNLHAGGDASASLSTPGSLLNR